METPPGFNLNQAIAAWLDDCEVQLRAAFAELRKCNISDEEAFVLARLRMGSPRPGSAESAQSKRNYIWRPYLFWLAFGVFAYVAWGTTVTSIMDVLQQEFGQMRPGFTPNALWTFAEQVMPFLVAAWWLVRGVPQSIAARLSSRAQMAVIGGGMFLLMLAYHLYAMTVIYGGVTGVNASSNLVLWAIYDVWPIALIVWLAPYSVAVKSLHLTSQRNAQANTSQQTPSSFNLDQAVAAWRAELARQPGLVSGDLRELESHLRDGFAELRQNQLTDEEAFLLAHRRVGTAEPVAAEFAKTAPQQVWAQRIFWLACGILMAELCPVIVLRIQIAVDNELWRLGIGEIPDWLYAVENQVLSRVAPVLIAVWCLAKEVPKIVSAHLATRKQVAIVGVGLLVLARFDLTVYWLKMMIWEVIWPVWPSFMSRPQEYPFTADVVWQICLLALMVWLTPRVAKTKALAVAA